MIHIIEKKDCCGCSACVQCCPKQCISLFEDEEGFLYPKVDVSLCIDCGLCEKVCPVMHQGEPHKPLKVYAARNNDEEIRRQSSSGGIFTRLAEEVILEGGVVFGARFDENWEVEHGYVETMEGLAAFRGSKYLQSRMGNCFKDVRTFLKQGRKVLFSGTPCQVSGLKKFLRSEYDNLLTVDFVCHGVPSPGVWRTYLKETIARECEKNSVSSDPISVEDARVESISFRDKCVGWKKFSFTLTLSATQRSGAKNTVSLSEVFPENIFMKGFLADLYLRPSCYHCPSKCMKSGSDVTIADLWGAQVILPENDDDKGLSLVMLNNDRIGFPMDSRSVWMEEIDYQEALKFNPSIERSVRIPAKRTEFFLLLKESPLREIVLKLTRIGFLARFVRFGKRMVRRILSVNG